MPGLEAMVSDFIKNIPEAKLKGLTTKANTTIYQDKQVGLRLDMQKMTSGDPKHHNLQVQLNRINKKQKNTSKVLGKSVTKEVLVPLKDPWVPAKIKAALLDAITIETGTVVSGQPKQDHGILKT